MLGITTEEEEPNEVDYSYRKNHKMMKIGDLKSVQYIPQNAIKEFVANQNLLYIQKRPQNNKNTKSLKSDTTAENNNSPSKAETEEIQKYFMSKQQQLGISVENLVNSRPSNKKKKENIREQYHTSMAIQNDDVSPQL